MYMYTCIYCTVVFIDASSLEVTIGIGLAVILFLPFIYCHQVCMR